MSGWYGAIARLANRRQEETVCASDRPAVLFRAIVFGEDARAAA